MRLLLVLVLSLAAFAQTPPESAARNQLNLGVQAFRSAHYEQAIEHFRAATEIDPELSVARLYLATTYAQLYIPGADTPENNRFGELAIQEFRRVLDMSAAPEATKLHSVKGIASLYFNMKRLDDAAEWYQKLADADPEDAEAFYSIGVIRWTQSYMPRMELRAKLGLQPTDSMSPGAACAEIRAKNEQKVEDGIRLLTRALEIRKDYDDAMAYINLLYRERADYECDDPKARAADLKKADHWVDLTMAMKKRKAEAEQNVPTTGLDRKRPTGGGGGGGTTDRTPH